MWFAYYVHDLSPFLIQFTDSIGVRWYGLAYLAAFASAWWFLVRFSRRGLCEIPEEKLSDFILWLAIVGVIVGGRLGYMLLYNFHEWMADPVSILRVWDGGMASHGGITGVALFSLWYARKHHYSWRNIGDNLVVVAPLGLFFGRMANFINGELYGRATDVAWAVQFPQEIRTLPIPIQREIVSGSAAINPAWNSVPAIEEGVRNSPQLRDYLADWLTPRHPSQIYEGVLEGLLLFLVLWIARTRLRVRDGVLTGWFFIGYALLRILGELFREPDAPLTGPFTRGQFLSLFLILVGVGFLWSTRIRPSWAPTWRKIHDPAR
jgi:phosphatidylglycerol:prolipoprotein diacylglycerol transferase